MAPVTQTQSDGAWVVQFTIPGAYSLERLPEPNDPKVKLRAVAPARFAVIRLSGLASRANVEAKTAEVIDFAKAHPPHSPNITRLGPFGSCGAMK